MVISMLPGMLYATAAYNVSVAKLNGSVLTSSEQILLIPDALIHCYNATASVQSLNFYPQKCCQLLWVEKSSLCTGTCKHSALSHSGVTARGQGARASKSTGAPLPEKN